jgi:Peptidase propeptide and YPEB domain
LVVVERVLSEAKDFDMKFSYGLPLIIAALAVPAIAKQPLPKITEAQARATALSFVKGGIVKDEELETENGRLIYSYDIKQKGVPGVEEIQISAITGKLVSRRHETPAKEAAEKAADMKAAKAK